MVLLISALLTQRTHLGVNISLNRGVGTAAAAASDQLSTIETLHTFYIFRACVNEKSRGQNLTREVFNATN
jgi:hypothetical protein